MVDAPTNELDTELAALQPTNERSLPRCSRRQQVIDRTGWVTGARRHRSVTGRREWIPRCARHRPHRCVPRTQRRPRRSAVPRRERRQPSPSRCPNSPSACTTSTTPSARAQPSASSQSRCPCRSFPRMSTRSPGSSAPPSAWSDPMGTVIFATLHRAPPSATPPTRSALPPAGTATPGRSGGGRRRRHATRREPVGRLDLRVAESPAVNTWSAGDPSRDEDLRRCRQRSPPGGARRGQITRRAAGRLRGGCRPSGDGPRRRVRPAP